MPRQKKSLRASKPTARQRATARRLVDPTPASASVPGLRTAGKEMTSRSRFFDNVDGMSFHGRRNMYEALGYPRVITPQMYRSRYKRNAVAGRIVDAKPKATWRGGAEVVENDDTSQTEFEKAFESLEKRLNLWSIFHRADQLAGLGRYSIILLGTPGNLEEPLEMLDIRNLVYLTPFSEDDAQVEKFETDPKKPRFGLPKFYAVRRMSPSGSVRSNNPETVGRRVHWTRVIHIADGLLDDHVYGIPRLERVWNLLDDLEKVTGGGAEAFWMRADQGTVFQLDPMVQITQDPATGKFTELEAMKEQIHEYEHNRRRMLTMRGVKVERLGSDVADIKSTTDALITQIAVGCEIPRRILEGSEQGKLASIQDADNWDERILDRRTEFAAPQVVRPFVQRLLTLGALPKLSGDHFEVRWPEMKNLNESQRADVATKWANLNKNAGETVVRGDEIREHVLGLDPLGRPARAEIQALPKLRTEPGELDRATPPAMEPPTNARWSRRRGSPWARR